MFLLRPESYINLPDTDIRRISFRMPHYRRASLLEEVKALYMYSQFYRKLETIDSDRINRMDSINSINPVHPVQNATNHQKILDFMGACLSTASWENDRIKEGVQIWEKLE